MILNRRFSLDLLALALVALIAVGPMLQPGYWWGAHDARHAVYFLFEFEQALRDTWWPRWAPDFAFGYGYPFFNVYGPLTTYVGALFLRLGAGYIGAVKLSFALGVLLSGWAMYGLARRLFGARAGLVAGVAYLLLPYHLADLYLRAAMAESWAFVWLPLVFWGFYECAIAPRARAVALTALAYAAFFLTHPGLVMQATVALIPWVLFWLLWNRWPWRQRLRGALASFGAALLGPLAGGLFVIPWLTEARFVNQDQWFQGYFDYGQHFVALWQLFSPYWGAGISVAGPGDTFPFQLGLVPLLLAVAGWLLPLDGAAAKARLFFTAMLVGYAFLMLDASRFIWSSPLGEVLLRPMQFPWRFLILAGFALALLAGVVARVGRGGEAALLAVLLLAGTQGMVQADLIEPPEGPVSYAGLMRFQQSAGEMTGQSACVTLDNIPTWSPLADVWVGGGEVTSRFDYSLLPTAGKAESRSNQEIVEVLVEQPQTVRWFITDYPGWHAYRLPLDADAPMEELPIVPMADSCHLTVEAPAGHYRLLVRFEETPMRRAGAVASVMGLGIILFLLLIPRYSSRHAITP